MLLSIIIVLLAYVNYTTATFPARERDCRYVPCPLLACNNPLPPDPQNGFCCSRCPPDVDCRAVRCAEPVCPNPIPAGPGECCSRCLEDCRVILCARPTCSNPITPLGRCCPICSSEPTIGPPLPPLPTIGPPIGPPSPPIGPPSPPIGPPSPPIGPPSPPIGPPSPPIGPPTPSCSIEGQVFDTCASPCPATCETQNPICILSCVANCTCRSGTVLDRRVNRCVTSDQCGACESGTPAVQCLVNPCDFTTCDEYPDAECLFDNCGGCSARFFVGNNEVTDQCSVAQCPVEGQVFQNCRSCPRTCSEPDIACTAQCIPGCGCPFGQVIDEDNNRCVDLSQCPRPGGGRSCPIEGQVIQSCPACPATCDEPNLECRRLCRQGCGCPPGEVIDETNNRCVLPSQCPNRQLCSIPGQTFFTGCKPCTVTCSNVGQLVPCPAICQPGCACRLGTVLDEVNNRCVREEECGREPCLLPLTQRPQCAVPVCSVPLQISNDPCGCPFCPAPNDRCFLPSDSGPCEAAITRYFFDGTNCRQFTYGGCGGNANRFRSLAQCERECQNKDQDNKCLLPQDRGPCRALISRYFYNSNTRSCERFFYGGCAGNDNNFRSLSDCLEECSGSDVSPPAGDNVCQLPRNPGPCYAFFLRYFYNSFTRKCEKFIYGGCQGNGNNFNSLEACKRRCNSNNNNNRRGPPTCSQEYCRGHPGRVCTIKEGALRIRPTGPSCSITVCRSCYHSPFVLPVPRIHSRCPRVLSLADDCRDTRKLQQWSVCVNRAMRRYRRRFNNSANRGSFRCWKPPFSFGK